MEMNIAWLYPDILNLHGDRGNMMAFAMIAQSMDMVANIKRVNSHDDIENFDDIDIIYMGTGQLRDMKHVIDDMENYAGALSAYIDNGGYMLVTGSTGCVLGKSYTLDDNTEIKGLGLLDMTAKELCRTKAPFVTREVYGDDILWRTSDGMEIAGCQIQRMDFTLQNELKPFGELIYGYGNNCMDGKEGARYKNLMFTNTVGPILSSNPWLGIKLFEDIFSAKGEPLAEYDKDSLSYMKHAKESLELKKKFIREKSKQHGITYKGC